MTHAAANTNEPDTIFAMQDGADFYFSYQPDVETFAMVESAPFSVTDFDMDAATRARSWFLENIAGDGRKVVWQ